MKKMMITLAIALSTLSAFAGGENVNSKVLDAFRAQFTTAKEVEWTTGENFYKATFTYNDKHIFAFYDLDGQLMGLSRYISPVDLPMILQGTLNSKYSNYWISDLFELSKNDETGYYITLENADTKIVLKAIGGSEWSVYKKTKKS